MSRLSRAPFNARESIFAGGPGQYRGDIQAICPPHLEECVMAMEDCCEEAFEAQQLLRNGTKDLPRMNKILQSERVFLLVNEKTVRKYKADLAEEVEPAINELVQHAEQGLKALERQESALKAKVEAARSDTRRPATAGGAAQRADARRLQLLIKQREMLEEEAKALEAEVNALELEMLNQ